jgi:hypothetical protein
MYPAWVGDSPDAGRKAPPTYLRRRLRGAPEGAGCDGGRRRPTGDDSLAQYVSPNPSANMGLYPPAQVFPAYPVPHMMFAESSSAGQL